MCYQKNGVASRDAIIEEMLGNLEPAIRIERTTC